MSTIAEEIQKPLSKKIYIAEIDITQLLPFATNWRAGSWMVNLDVLYPVDPAIDPTFLIGVDPIVIFRIGSMKSDGLLLHLVASANDVQDNELSFYWDQVAKNLYFHLQNGDTWTIHRVTIGEVFGVSDFAAYYNEILYEARLKRFPGIDRDKDPLFFGRLRIAGGQIEIDNTDGEFDTFCEDRNVVGAVCRVKQGFEGLAYLDFKQTAEGIAEKYSVGPAIFAVDFRDRRAGLDTKIPAAVFEQTAYPFLKDGNIGKSIPIAYGLLRNTPVICTNEAEAPAPANYTFKLADTTYHGISAITEIRVKGVAKAPSATNLNDATFSLAAANYSPGDEVRVDFAGYTDVLGNLISNPLDIICDLLITYYPIKYNSNYFNTGEWEIAKLKSSDVHYFADKPIEIEKIIEEICNSTFLSLLPLADGRYTARYYNPFAPALQTIYRDEVMETPTIEYDSTQMIRYVRVGYDRDWAEDDFKYYLHDSGDERTNRSKTIETLLTNEADALAFAETVILLAGDECKPFDVKLKLQALNREVMDFIEVEIWRPRKKMLGWVKAEVLGIHQEPEEAGMTLNCRIVELIPETIPVEGVYYDDSYYGDGLYSDSSHEEVA